MAGRVTQVATEGVVLPTSQLARVTQVATEGVVLPTSQLARVTQVAIEVLVFGLAPAFVGEPGGGYW